MFLFILNIHSNPIHRDWESISCFPGAPGREEWEVTANMSEISLWNNENLLELGSSSGYTTL